MNTKYLLLKIKNFKVINNQINKLKKDFKIKNLKILYSNRLNILKNH